VVPNHITAGFPTAQCTTCHNTTTWTSTFNHATTGFPLTNAHQMAPAGKSCGLHGLPHQQQLHFGHCADRLRQLGMPFDHLAADEIIPVHSSAGAPYAAANCSTCHNTITWTTATFDHNTTGFPLTGSHQMAPAGKVVACTDCHVGQQLHPHGGEHRLLRLPPSRLAKHHDARRSGTESRRAGFPTSQCSTCHTTTTWTSTFNHATTGFPLTNAHQMAPAGKAATCASCHINNNYALTIAPTDCGNSGCHLTTWQQTNNQRTSLPALHLPPRTARRATAPSPGPLQPLITAPPAGR